MICKNCGNPMNDGQKFCSHCGTPADVFDMTQAADVTRQPDDTTQAADVTRQPEELTEAADRTYPSYGYNGQQADQHRVYQEEMPPYQMPRQQNYRSNEMPEYMPQPMQASPKKSRKTSTMVIAMVLVFLSVAIIAVTVALLVPDMWKKSLSTDEAYQEYSQILEDEKDEIEDYSIKLNVKPVAIHDINNSGVNDLIYLKADPVNPGYSIITIAVDKDGEIKRLPPISAKGFIFFMRASDGAIFEYVTDGDTDYFYRISLDDGSRQECYSRRRIPDSDSYEYTYEEGGKTVTGSEAEKKFQDFVNSLKEEKIDVIASDLSEDEIDERLPDSEKDYATTSYEEAVDIINDIIAETEPDGGEVNDERGSTTDTFAPTERKAEKIKVADLPEQDSLKKFLEGFSCWYWVKDGDDISREYNNSDAKSGLVDKMIVDTSCISFDDYPGSKVIRKGGSNSDPKKRFSNGYVLIEKNKAQWVMENILNIEKDKAKSLLKEAVSGSNVYETKSGSTTYLCGPVSGKGGPGYEISFKAAKYDGEKYYIVFDVYPYGESKETTTDLRTYYAEMSLKEIDGKTYWTLYRQSETIPDWGKTADAEKATEKATEKETEPQTDAFGQFAGTYYLSSGAGAWGETLYLNSDGTFSGTYSDSNMGENGDGYDSTRYAAEFSGTFSNPQKINDYTYSFEMTSIEYVEEPGTEEIIEDGENHSTRYVYTEALGLDGGTYTVYAYTADAPWDDLPEDYRRWASLDRTGNTSSELGFNGLYAPESKCGWRGEKD